MRRGWVEEHDESGTGFARSSARTRIRPGTVMERGTARGVVRDDREAAAAAELIATPRGPNTVRQV